MSQRNRMIATLGSYMATGRNGRTWDVLRALCEVGSWTGVAAADSLPEILALFTRRPILTAFANVLFNWWSAWVADLFVLVGFESFGLVVRRPFFKYVVTPQSLCSLIIALCLLVRSFETPRLHFCSPDHIVSNESLSGTLAISGRGWRLSFLTPKRRARKMSECCQVRSW